MTPHATETVLVTGANGFVAMHCILKLLNAGYHVRGTLRSLARAAELLDVFKQHAGEGIDVSSRLTFCQATLDRDSGWADAARDCAYVLHVASPVPHAAPANADAVIGPAREGTLRVLQAAAAHSVRRVVLTSSTAAVLYGHARDGTKVYDENDWSELTRDVGAYERSKTLAERDAWEFVRSLPPERPMELVAINPGVVLGPLLDAHVSVSAEIVRKLLTREMPGCPDLGWAIVDVRDVADAHVAAMTAPAAAGQRFIVALEHVSMLQIAQILATRYAPLGFRVPARRLPDWTLKLVGLFDKTAALVIPELGKRQDVSNARAREILGWKPRGVEETLVSTAESMIRYKLVTTRALRSQAA